MSDLDDVIRRALTSFTEDVFRRKWAGMEREAVSLFAFGHLVRQCRTKSVLSDPGQIGIEVRVIQPGKFASNLEEKGSRVCKDLVVWALPGATWRDRVSPLAVLEWKTNKAEMSSYDVKFLEALSAEHDTFTGYAICLDLEERNFRLSVTRVENGHASREWMKL